MNPIKSSLVYLFATILLSSVLAAAGAEEPNASSEPAPAPAPQAAQAMSLEAAVAIAEQNSPNLRQAAAEVEAARGRTRQAGLYPNPQVVGGAMQLAARDSQYFSQLSQEIVTKGKLRLDRAAASREVNQADLRFIRARFDLLTAVRQGFFTALAAQRRVEVLRQLVEIAGKSQRAAVSLQKGGEGTVADTLLLEIELERAEVGLQNAEATLEAARKQLAAAMGTRDSVGPIDGDLTAKLPDYAEELVAQGYLTQNALVQIAEVEVERTRLLLRRAEVEPFPNVTVGAGYIYQVEAPNNMAVLEVGFPIPVWNRNQGNIQAARANIGKAAETVSRTQNELAGQLAGAVGRYQAADQQVKRYEEKILPKARRSMEITQQAYIQGQFDFLRLLQAQRALVESDLNYVNAQETRWTAAAEIAGIIQMEQFP